VDHRFRCVILCVLLKSVIKIIKKCVILICYKSLELIPKFEKLREKTHYKTNFQNDEEGLYKIFIKEVKNTGQNGKPI
jgi:hypothetical protein